MAFPHEVWPCPDHPACTLILCRTDADVRDEAGRLIYSAGAEVWRSHAPDSLDPASRLNPDYPAAIDRRPGKSGAQVRWRPPTLAELQVLNPHATQADADTARAAGHARGLV